MYGYVFDIPALPILSWFLEREFRDERKSTNLPDFNFSEASLSC